MIGQLATDHWLKCRLIPMTETQIIMIRIYKPGINMRVLSLLFIAVIIYSCNENSSTETVKKETKIDSVVVFVLKTDSIKKDISLPAELEPNENAQIRAKAQG